ncbi:MAG TPA: aromatic ring-hydroxylating dioxygenase subunit alpha [Acidimicrobiales bacterium]|nr:aromatic ring-hydroxylating dioxygenase subunit alpha [Acidimicrobiales bacterium]
MNGRDDSPVVGALRAKLEEAPPGWEEGRGLPPECYNDDTVFELERANIFSREWLCVGRADQIPNPGDYLTLTLVDEPLIVLRGEDGTVRVLSAICRHRGMVLTEPWDGEWGDWFQDPPDQKGNCGRAFRCPYHFWTYGLDGHLIGAPEMQHTPSFDRGEIFLPKLNTEIWQGFVFVNFDDDAAPLAGRLEPLSDLIGDWGLSAMVTEEPAVLKKLPWNWKIMQENSMDVYHVDRLHFPRHAVLPGAGYLPVKLDTGDAAIVAGHRATHKDFALSPIGKPLLPVIKTLSDDERSLSYVICVPPTLLIILNSDSTFYRIVHPRGANQVDIRQTLMVPEEYRSLPNYRDLVQVGASMHLRLNHQDYMVDGSLQRATHSRFAPRGPYGWQEGIVAEFDDWVARRCRRTEPASGNGHVATEHA